MTLTPSLRSYLSTLPGRCDECCWHRKQGHNPACSRYTPPRFVDRSSPNGRNR